MKIGDKVWIFDSNQRVYEDQDGNKTSRAWYRGYFVEKYIIGETKQSWIIGNQNREIDHTSNIKVNKKTLTYKRGARTSLDEKLYVSEEIINQECWIKENRCSISEAVNRCNDYDKLKKIEEILNS